MMRQFCTNCGSLLFTVSDDRPGMEEIVVVYSGSLDGPHVGGPGGGVWKPQIECFTKNRATFLPEFEVGMAKFKEEVRFDEGGGLKK